MVNFLCPSVYEFIVVPFALSNRRVKEVSKNQSWIAERNEIGVYTVERLHCELQAPFSLSLSATGMAGSQRQGVHLFAVKQERSTGKTIGTMNGSVVPVL